ncbi:MAG TPA: DUF4917 family protein [Phycisphaerae bacterium]|nr:DUF4917 family protein [Phycisphaerae bacterium]
MSKPKLLTFDNALGQADKQPHVLLGNGFSIACRADIFQYGQLFDRADFKDLEVTARAAFAALQTTDFEIVMRALRQAAKLAAVYAKKQPGLGKRLRRDADGLREVLASTIASSHPNRPADIQPEQYTACRTFLSRFRSIYTVNYDLLLYWALMQSELEPQISGDDGFRQPEDGPEQYVTWEVDRTDTQSVHYLHGALHVFDAGSEVQKYTWCNTGMALIDQIRAALASDKYPLFVAEGSAEEKLDRIQHSGFLNRSYRSFAKISGPLVIFGHSLAENDEHILHLIDRGKMSPILVGLYGDPASASNRQIIERAKRFPSNRPPRRAASVQFFDAESARVWG